MNNCDLVSVIVPTYNRYELLLSTINSVANQTYKNIELIVVDDCSPDARYNNLLSLVTTSYPNFNFQIIKTDKNSSEMFGFPSAGYVRNLGLKVAKGNYIAFCDDDDIWLPYKISLQVDWMKKNNVEMSASEAYILKRPLNEYEVQTIDLSEHKLYNGQHFFDYLSKKLEISKFPLIWDKSIILRHNIIITSSVCITRKLLDLVGNMKEIRNGKEDYEYWLRCLDYTNCVYVHIPCLAYADYNVKFYSV